MSINASLSLFCNECGAANSNSETDCYVCGEQLPVALPFSSSTRVLTTVQPVNTALALPASTALAPLAPGFRLVKRYKIIEQVGEGGFGMVYKARDRKKCNKLVAVKQINLHQLTMREMIDATDSYNREVSLLSKIRHPNLPRMYTHFADSTHWYIVMDFIKGETLEDYVKNAPGGRLSVKEALTIGMRLSTVLQYLHTKHRIIFRDVKPANVMITKRGRLYLIDFGIARRYVQGKQDTGSLGSPGYAAPEQYGRVHTTNRTDIYGLGATLQTLLTGEDLSNAQTGGGIPAQDQPIPTKLRQLLDQMLELDASKRPESMKEVRRKLQFIRDGIAGLIARYGLACLCGPLLGSTPYSIPRLIIYFTTVPGISSSYFDTSLYCVLCYSLPLFIVGQFIYALVLSVSSQSPLYKRLFGLWMLVMMIFMVFAFFQGMLP